MTRVFLDTDVLVGLHDVDDKLHERVQGLIRQASQLSLEPVVSTNILLESLTLISQRVGKQTAIDLLDELRSGMYQVVNPGDELILKAEEIFRGVASKNVSYSDCVSFAVCRRLGVEWVFSFDLHFKKQGFKRVGVDGFPT